MESSLILANEFDPSYCNDAKFGDIIVDDSGYRYDGAYFIGKNGEHIINPDNTKTCHLSIPYDITQYLEDALNKYKYISYYDIELRYDDKFIVDSIGHMDESMSFNYFYTPDEMMISIKYPNNIYMYIYKDEFPRVTPEMVIEYYDATKIENSK